MMKISGVILVLIVSIGVWAQEQVPGFEVVKLVPHTPVISQGRTGTCWSFATTSFLESELLRQGIEVDLSEMFFVYHNYKNKAFQYLLYHGRNNFGEGSLSHDVMKVVREQGVMLQSAYPGKKVNGKYNHSALLQELRQEVDEMNKVKKGKVNVAKLKPIESYLKKYMGRLPGNVEWQGKKYRALKLREALNINPDDYVELTSVSHHPFYRPCVLEVPDNWAHALYYNLPLDDLVEVVVSALENGYSIAWDGDTSEKTFEHKKGMADVPRKWKGKVDQTLRAETFFNRTTTDDHLMHMVGLSKRENGERCFYTKNSWGTTSNDFGGYLHMTEDYVRLKTIGIMVHKDAIPENIKLKLNL